MLVLGGAGIELVGEIGDGDTSELLGYAPALLNPIDWPEPFGLVMAEALACGTPFVARRRRSAPEVARLATQILERRTAVAAGWGMGAASSRRARVGRGRQPRCNVCPWTSPA
jgi:hypothetical protein